MNRDDQTIAQWVSILYRYGQSYINKHVESFNMGSGQCIVLAALYDKNGTNLKQISDYLKIDKSTITKAVQKLESEGYIRREIDETDKRSYKIFLNQKAMKIEAELFEVIRKWEDMLMFGISENERVIILELLDKMAENVSKAT